MKGVSPGQRHLRTESRLQADSPSHSSQHGAGAPTRGQPVGRHEEGGDGRS